MELFFIVKDDCIFDILLNFSSSYPSNCWFQKIVYRSVNIQFNNKSTKVS